MDRRRLTSVIGVVIALAAVSVTAASFGRSGTSGDGSGELGGSDGTDGGIFGGENGGMFPDHEYDYVGISSVFEPIIQLLVIGMLLATIAYIVVLFVVKDIDELLEMLRNAVKMVVIVVGLLFLLFVIFEVFSLLFGGGGGDLDPGSESPGDVADVATDPGSSFPIELTIVLAVLVIGIAGIALVMNRTAVLERASGRSTHVSVGSPSDSSSRRGSRGEDRMLDQSDVTNEVHRSWRNMTDLLPQVDRHRSTPREIASTAIDAGYDETAVDGLTTLFERARYGHTEVTGDDEEKAKRLLERIRRSEDLEYT